MIRLQQRIICLVKNNYLVSCIILLTLIIIIRRTYYVMPHKATPEELKFLNGNNDLILTGNIFSNSELRTKLLKQKVERLSRNIKKSRSIYLDTNPLLNPSYNVHIFYYAWYGNLKYDGFYKHWNHTYLPNWKHANKIYPTGFHDAPTDIGSNFYPKLGCYSSKDQFTINQHMKQIKNAGVGVVVLSWSPPGFKDSPHEVLRKLFDIAHFNNIKIAIHVEPYTGRNPINLIQHLKVLLREYGKHPAMYKVKKPLSKKKVPMFYIYDSYLTPDSAWREILNKKGSLTIRNTIYDALFIGLLVDLSHRSHIKKSHFDGFYTYFAANSFSYGSTWKNWKSLARYSLQNGLIFIPSLGPGYADTQIRPWNSVNTRHRRHGQYYDVAWQSAININARYISITSFNEWHEGTQIEPAVSKNVHGFNYLDYEPEGPEFYINLTRSWVLQFEKASVE